MEYLERVADIELKERLEAIGAVYIKGPKWCGKSTTAGQQAKSTIFLQDPDKRAEYLATGMTTPSVLLRGDTPRLIDEWQDIPLIWDAVRMEVDRRSLPGQFILTGSNAVDSSEIMHTGTGRITRMKMLPMSLWESKESTGEVSLQALFDDPNQDIEGISRMSIADIIFAACRGGWPATLQAKTDVAKLLTANDYVTSVCEYDISNVDKVSRDPKLTRMILRSYARNISTLALKTSILADVTASDNIECSRGTFDDYIKALEKLYVIDDLDAWCPAIRSKTVIRSTPKRCFCDPSVAVAALELSPEALQMQLKTFGFIFEQLCIRDLRAFTQNNFYSHLSYYHDRYGLEADIVLHMNADKYALIECKLGSREIDDGAKHLLELKRLIIEHNQKEKQMPIREPDVLMIITGGQYAYRRKDGVYVVPIGCLKP